MRVLIVDDEPRLLMAVKRALHGRFDIDIAQSGKEGLEKIKKANNYAVVISDLKMPVMDGIQFLSRVKEVSPDTVRIMLTGFAELDTAIEAINSGNVFRFLTKPCSTETLASAIEAAIKQYKLVKSEKELLEKTLRGCVKLLTEILSLTNPEAFGRSSRIARWVVWIARELGYEELWKIETAALLSQLGCLLVPEEAVLKVYKGEPLSDEERQMMDMHPSVASHLLRHIPRLDSIATIIEYQEKHFDGTGFPRNDLQGEEIPFESRILKLAIDFEQLLTAGHEAKDALQVIKSRKGVYDPQLLPALERIVHIYSNYQKKKVSVSELKEGMIIGENVMSMDGRLLIREGHEMTETIIRRLQNFAKTVGIVQPITVYVLA